MNILIIKQTTKFFKAMKKSNEWNKIPESEILDPCCCIKRDLKDE